MRVFLPSGMNVCVCACVPQTDIEPTVLGTCHVLLHTWESCVCEVSSDLKVLVNIGIFL